MNSLTRFSAILLLIVPFLSAAQVSKQKNFRFAKSASVRFDTIRIDFMPGLLMREMPRHGADKIEHYNYPPRPAAAEKTSASTSATLSDVAVGFSAFSNPWGLSTPNDNDLAISDSGFVVSVVNTNIHIRNISTGTVYPVKSLAAFTSPVNSRHQEFDPKVLYDPESDRFILMCMVGFVDSTSKMIVGFSQTSDPTGTWNLYTIPGNPLNNNLWSDYPMIAITKKELFLSVNLLTNNSSWQTGFVETLVWQMKKDSGYAGLPLGSVLHSGIQFNGKNIRNLCPAKGGSQLYGPNMYFVSNRNFASQNDSIFLVNVTDTIGAPSLTVTTQVLISNQPYYFPPNGTQTVAAHLLATNDARNLGAFFENNKIQFVSNTSHPANNKVSVYYGIIDQPASVSPTVTAYYIPNDSADYAYPNISYAGNGTGDDRSILVFNHSSSMRNPGLSVVKSDGSGGFSFIRGVATGSTVVNVISGSSVPERWGDYSGSQRRYKNPGEVWVSGYYAYRYSSLYPNAHGTWVAQIFRDEDMFTGLNELESKTPEPPALYPNPASSYFSLDLTLTKPEYLSFELYDSQGKCVTILLKDWVKVSQNTFSFNTQNLKPGVYILKVIGQDTQIQKKIILEP